MSSSSANIKRSGQKQPRKSGNTIFPIITLQKLSVAIEVLNRSSPKPNVALLMMLHIRFDHDRPNGLFENVDTHTHPCTDGRQFKAHPIIPHCEPSDPVSLNQQTQC